MKYSGVEWIGDIPDGWNSIKLKYLLLSNDGGIWGNEPTNTDDDKTVIRSTEQTMEGKWAISSPAKRDLSGIKISRYKIIPNDLLMTKSSGSSLHIGKTTLADNFFRVNECYYSNFIQRLRLQPNLSEPKFIWYILNSVITKEQFVYLQNSTSGIGNINANDIDNIEIPYPPLNEQQKIAEYLNYKCGQVDGLIANQQAQIEKLKQYKQSVITEAVTRGLNPSAPLKDSGINWIGSIPENWEVVNLSSIFKQHKNKNVGMVENNLLSLSYGKIKSKDINTSDGLLPESFESYNIIEPNDIVFRLTDLQNDHKSLRTGLCTERGIITSAYVTIRATIKLDSRYMQYLYHSYDCSKVFYGFGDGVRQGMGYDDLKSLTTLLPPFEEQQQIADYLNNKCGEIDRLISLKQQKIDALTSYKKSLIYEYVTGKKEVV